MKLFSNLSLRKLAVNESGNVAMLFGLFTIPMFSVMGLAVDYARVLHAQTELQSVVDAAAIAGARLPATANHNRYQAASANLTVNLTQTGLAGVLTDIDANNAEVKVEAGYTYPTIVMSIIGYETVDVRVLAAARSQVENGGVACLLALNTSTDDGLHLQGINKSSSENCWAWVNSTSPTAINAVGTALGTAQGFCTAGGVAGAEHFLPSPFAGCEPIADPFQERFAAYTPASETCDHTDVVLKNGTYILSPGVYCGDLVLKPQAEVTFEPGIYVIKNGYFEIQGGASAQGDSVTFFFRGSGTRLIVRGGGDIDFSAPTTGDTAGFLFIDRKWSWQTTINETVIQGGGRVKMEGILYAPQWRVNISGNGEINQDAQYFAMIADHFYMEGNGRLFIKSDALAAGMPDLMPKIKSGPVLTR